MVARSRTPNTDPRRCSSLQLMALFTHRREIVETLLPVSRSRDSCPVDSLILSWSASSSVASWVAVWAEPRCSMTVSLPWRFVTIWTAVAPEAVGTLLSR